MTITHVYRRAALALVASLAIGACSDTDIESPGSSTAPPPPPPPPPPPAALVVPTVTLSGNITSNTTIPAGSVVQLSGKVVVGGASSTTTAGVGTASVNGPTLTIGAGSEIYGETTEDFLVIAAGANIEAVGTTADPITFTSLADLEATASGTPRDATSTASGEWGGLVINGLAPINACSGSAVGGAADCQKEGEGASGLFGGDDPNDTSGRLSYVRVFYAGSNPSETNQLNGIAFQGVGRNTQVDHIQIHNNLDDGIEFFGGTVNAKYVVVTGAGDDSIDWTDGWTGNLQFAVVRQTEGVGDRGIEGDNLENAPNSLPRSAPTVSNFTFIGGEGAANNDSGMVLRRGTAGTFANGILRGWPDAGIDVDGDDTDEHVTSGLVASDDLVITSILTDNGDDVEDGDEASYQGFGTLTELFANKNFVIAGNNVANDSTTLVDVFFPGQNEANVAVFTGFDSPNFFQVNGQDIDYIGAFSPQENLDANWAAGWTFALFDTDPAERALCPTGTVATSTFMSGKEICQLTGTLTSDITLRDGDELVYEFDGKVVVGEDVGGDFSDPNPAAQSAILTINAGVTLFGRTTEDYLVVSRGSQLRANGTVGAPVSFTSAEDAMGLADASADVGLWGGLVINGRAPINACDDGGAVGGSANCEKEGEGASGLFGGDGATDNSGRLIYTRVLYAGSNPSATNQLNGIAFQGVGSETQVDYVQVHNNLDDGIEFFGGTVTARHLVISGAGDDGLDWTDGWTGKVQYAIVHQSALRGERGIEADNLENAPDSLPRSSPTVANFTLVGGGVGGISDTGAVLRRGTAGRIVNGIAVNWPDAGLDVDGDDTDENVTSAQIASGALVIDAFFSDNADDVEDSDEAAYQGQATLSDLLAIQGLTIVGDDVADDDNTLSGSASSIYPASGIGYVPGAAELAVTAHDLSNDSFFDNVTYVGAVEDAADTWYSGWTVTVPSP